MRVKSEKNNTCIAGLYDRCCLSRVTAGHQGKHQSQIGHYTRINKNEEMIQNRTKQFVYLRPSIRQVCIRVVYQLVRELADRCDLQKYRQFHFRTKELSNVSYHNQHRK